MTAIRYRSIVSVSAFAFALLVTRAHGAPVRQGLVASGVDWTAAGVGGVSGGTGVISLSGVSGTVRQAFLYWHGIDEPELGGDGVYDNEAIVFAGHPIVGIPIGDSGTNCWPTIDQATGTSRSFRADVTDFVPGNGRYTLSGLSAKTGHSANGASLIVFFDDGSSENDRDVVVFEGNDSNVVGFPGEDDGWHATLTGIQYSGGSVTAQLHVADGQSFPDNSLTFTSTVSSVSIPDTDTLWDGVSVPNFGASRADNGSLWDIHSFDLTNAFSEHGQYTLSMDGQQFSGTSMVTGDCLSLVVLLLDFQAGSVPPPTTSTAPTTSTTTTTTSTATSTSIRTTTSTTTTLPPSLCGNGAVDPGEQCDLGAALNGTPGVCCTGTCAFRSAGEECRPAADPCDIAETCGGSGAACPADARKNVGDVCDDGDPATGISSCNSSGACTGVATMVTLQPETPVPPNESPKQVRIPLTLAVPDTKGKRATALAQGLVNCIDLPPSFRPAQCGTASAVAGGGLMTRVTSVFLRVTPPVKRSLGRSAARSVTMRLPLTKLGQRLFARLASQGEGLTVQIQCRLRDRQGRQIDVAAPTTLRRQH